MIKRTIFTRGPQLLLACCLFAQVAQATVTLKILTDEDMSSPVFTGRVTGPAGDIFWQGGEEDLDILDLPGVSQSTIGRNTVGSSSISLSDFTTSTLRSYVIGDTALAGPIVFGLNTVKSLDRRIETESFSDGVSADAQTAFGLSTVTFSTDNRFSYDNLSSENSTHIFTASTRDGFYLTAGQDPAVVFANPALFAGADPRVTQQGVIDHFNFIIANISRSDWRLLTFELTDFLAVQKDGVVSSIGNFSGEAFGATFVSFDRDAVPLPRTLVSAVLPASRSVQVGNPATFFAVIANASTSEATNCRVSPSIGPLGEFSYTRTDPATNAVIGSPDLPFDIPAGSNQTLVLSVIPSLELPTSDVPLDYRCATGNPATSVIGVNTLLLSASTEPTADIVGLTTVVDLIAPEGDTSLFAVASVNLGVTDNITVSLDTGGVPVPVNINLCQTDPLTGACSGPVGPETTLAYPAMGTATFAVFAQPTAQIENNPNAHRIFIRFADSAGNVRGATTTAIRTQ